MAKGKTAHRPDEHWQEPLGRHRRYPADDGLERVLLQDRRPRIEKALESKKY